MASAKFSRTINMTKVVATAEGTVLHEETFYGDLGIKQAERKMKSTDGYKSAVTADAKDVQFEVVPLEEKREMTLDDFIKYSTLEKTKEEKEAEKKAAEAEKATK